MLSPPPLKQIPFIIILIFLLAGLSVLINQLQLLQRWDNLFYDFESTIVDKPVDDNIVLVVIDDASLQKLGRWPWPRDIHARLLDTLSSVDAAAIGMDILFLEPDLMHPEYDTELASAIRGNGRVVLPVVTSVRRHITRVIKPLTEIAEAAAQLAHVNVHFDEQGVARMLDLQVRYDKGQALPAMSIALSRLAGSEAESFQPPPDGPVLIIFSGPPGYFRRISYADALFDEKVAGSLRGKVVLIGMTAAGLGSRFATPVSKSNRLMSGIEFQANALAAVSSGRIVTPVGLPSYALISLLLISIQVSAYPLFRYGGSILLLLGGCLLVIVVSLSLLNLLLIWFPPLETMLCLLLGYPLWNWRRSELLTRKLFIEHEKVSATLKAIGDAVITTDAEGRIELMNPAAEKMLDCTLTEVKWKYFNDICPIEKRKEELLSNSYFLTIEEQQADMQIVRNRQGQEYAVRVSSCLLNTQNGVSAGAVYAFSDLTEIININRKIAYIAAHDTLTGLPNRVLLQDRLQQAINFAKRKDLNFGILFIDLDGFKKINDGMGHAFGDLLLQKVAERLRNWVRQSDTIARWGGDEFVILLKYLTIAADAGDIAAKIINSLSHSFILQEQEVFVTPSIGISLFPDDGQQVEILLAKADAAMYSVKKNGRNNFSFYAQDLESKAKERLVMEKELHHALLTGEFELHYQPQIDLSSGRLMGSEALIRWRHPKKGLIAPDQFIPLAEETGLIVPLGEWIIKAVCQQIKIWEKRGLPTIKVAINLSPRQFVQKDLVGIITREISNQGISTAKLQVEITETMMIDNVERVIQILNNLKNAGISIAIDDFGTGYSSLEYLKRFPIDKLKIDKSFIGSVLHNQDDASIVQAVIALGHNMNMQIIAEGVENEGQASFLRQRLCDYGQGYYFSKPLPGHEMCGMIEKFNPVTDAVADGQISD